MSVALLARRDDAAVADVAHIDPTLPLAGEVLTVKACFDVAGWTTNAGSAVLADAPPAVADAPMVAALRSAGAIVLAQTNMTEFAYGALGLNSTYGSPRHQCVPARIAVSGGSTSGGAVAVALGVADLALGSDTSGSIRIPAAFCGVAGFKPSQGRYSAEGVIPLAASFDAPGLIASSMERLRRTDMAVDRPRSACRRRRVRSPTFGSSCPRDAIDAGMTDAVVLGRFDEWLGMLVGRRRHDRRERALPMLTEASIAAREGSMIAVEAYDWHRDLIAAEFDRYDQRVGPRIRHGATVLAADYVAASRRIGDCRRRYDEALHDADAIVTPTVAILPPRIAELDDDGDLSGDEHRGASADGVRQPPRPTERQPSRQTSPIADPSG